MTSSKPDAYTALVARLADSRPWGYVHIGKIEIDGADLHTVLLAYPDMAEEALSSKHLAQELTDELNSVYSPDTEDARIAQHIRTYLTSAAEAQLCEDVLAELISREDARESAEEPEPMPATESDSERCGVAVHFT